MRPFALLLAALPAFGQLSEPARWTTGLLSDYRLTPNVTYLTINGYDAKLDVYARADTSTPRPVLIWIHGGGWHGGSKEGSVFTILPWIEWGWNVVNVEYRLANVAKAPAAVEDCLCALRWVATNAGKYGFDTTRLVTGGDSAGGHLALTTAMIPESAGLANQCPGAPLPKVAAVVNYYGITDVTEMVDGPRASGWLPTGPARAQIARQVSPLTYVRPGVCPILTIHGDNDQIVPYNNGQKLHKALTEAGVPNELFTMTGAGHGGFNKAQRLQAHTKIRDFLSKHNLPAAP
ncbi:MAG: alpha/beta hydrolase [Bryobacterales bacterium]|nr:alpha/beta hydrolase [Bryobacterales bacterium]